MVDGGRRRRFVRSRRWLLRAGLLTSAPLLLAACGMPMPPATDPPSPPRIGVLIAGPRRPDELAIVDAFERGLRDLGYADGQTIRLDRRVSERDDQLPELARELVQLQVDILIAFSTVAARAAKEATSTTPVVFSVLGDPIAARLVTSLARPGANVTGFTGAVEGLTEKQLEVLKEAFPSISRVGFLWSSIQASQPPRLTAEVARALGVDLLELDANSPTELERVLQLAEAGRLDGLLVLPVPLMTAGRARIFEFAARNRLLAVYGASYYVAAGGLVAYGPSIPHLGQRLAAYVDRILKGARPTELPVERPTRFDLVINLKAARASGLTVSPSIVAQATELIE